MRRAWLLALLATPALSAAQTTPTPTAGQITYPTQVNTAIDKYINAAECRAGKITLSWAPEYVTTPTAKSALDLTGGSYQVYASDMASAAAVTSGPCPTTDGDKGVTGLHAGDVSRGRITGEKVKDPALELVFDTDLIASVAGLGSCDVGDTDVMLCVQARDKDGNAIGTARTIVTVTTTAPSAPVTASVSSGEQALNVSWGDSSSGSTPEYHIAQAFIGPMVDPTLSTTTLVASSGPVPGTGANDVRLEGLTNGVVYAAYVTAYSTADNPSDPLFAGTAPALQVNDFGELYRAAGGREQGGCAPGAAGPLALLGAVSLLALLRRRK